PLRVWSPHFMRRHNLQLYIGAVILALIIIAVACAPLLTRFDPTTTNPSAALQLPSAQHLFGTDNLGRDIWSRLLYGGRADLSIAAAAVIVPFLVGVLLGTICGYLGGWFDALIMRIADIVVAFPFYVLVITLVFVLGSGPSSIFIAISLVSWVAYARIVRGETMVLRTKEFIEAGTVSGIGTRRIVMRHIVPNVITQAVVYSMSDIVMNIGVIVTLSYFGLGIVPPTPDWGGMMSDGQQFLAGGYYALTLVPAAAVVLTSFALSLFGDGLAHILRISK
ncbi:MAG: peptide/nickel transport system permease protein, partial [Microbacteriaceae bacterium]|nr:peptide/nickel transport system permease protein [Microbacteriaceae bacterium]